MRQIAELLAAEWVVAEVLDDRAAVGIGMRLRNLVFRQRRKSLEQERPDLVFPEQVDNFLMRQDGIRKRATAAHQQDTEDECNNRRFSHVSFFFNYGEPGIRAPDARRVWRGGCFPSMTCSSPHGSLISGQTFVHPRESISSACCPGPGPHEECGPCRRSEFLSRSPCVHRPFGYRLHLACTQHRPATPRQTSPVSASSLESPHGVERRSRLPRNDPPGRPPRIIPRPA